MFDRIGSWLYQVIGFKFMLQQADQDHQEKQEHMPMGGHLFSYSVRG